MNSRENWHLTEVLIFVHFAVYIMTQIGQIAPRLLMFNPGLVVARPWSIVTFQFLHFGMLSFFFSMLVLWIMARQLEEEWGSVRFLLFYLISILGAAATAFVLGIPLAGDIFLGTSLLFTFATTYPDTEFWIFFLFPVKVKYLAVIGGAFLFFQGRTLGFPAILLYMTGMASGYLFFLLAGRFPSRRRLAFELKKKKAEIELRQETSSAEKRNLAWDPAVRRAEIESRNEGKIPAGMEPLLDELQAAVDPKITLCAPEDFRHVDDPVCRRCPGYPGCALRAIRRAANGEDPA